jgi:antitoxin MazE
MAIRLPAAVVEALNLKDGDEINIRVAGDFVAERKPTRKELIARIRKLGRPLPPGFTFDRNDANAR